MPEGTGDQGSPYRISDSQLRLLTGAQMSDTASGQATTARASSAGRIRTIKCRPSRPRVLSLCVGPLIPAVLLILSAISYWRSIPPGDLATRYLAVGLCSVFSGALFGGSLFLYMVYAYKAIDIEPGRMMIREGESMLTSSWSEVVTEPVRGGFVKTFVFHVAGRRKSIDSVFFVDFDEIVAAINDRVRTAHKLMAETTHVV